MITELKQIQKDQLAELERENFELAFQCAVVCKNLENLSYEELIHVAKVLVLSTAIQAVEAGTEPCLFV